MHSDKDVELEDVLGVSGRDLIDRLQLIETLISIPNATLDDIHVDPEFRAVQNISNAQSQKIRQLEDMVDMPTFDGNDITHQILHDHKLERAIFTAINSKNQIRFDELKDQLQIRLRGV